MGIIKIKNLLEENTLHYIDNEEVSLSRALSLDDFYQLGHSYTNSQTTEQNHDTKHFELKNYPKIAQMMSDINLFQEKIQESKMQSILEQHFAKKDFSRFSSNFSAILFAISTPFSLIYSSSYGQFLFFIFFSFMLSGVIYSVLRDTFKVSKLLYLKIRYWREIKQHHIYQQKLVDTLIEQISDDKNLLESIEEYSNKEIASSPLNLILRQLHKEFPNESWNTKDCLKRIALSDLRLNSKSATFPYHFNKAIWLLNLSEQSHNSFQEEKN